jgi:hypothetical protein
MQALFMNLVRPSSRFFFKNGPKKARSLSLDVKCDQETHKKNDVSNYGINLKKIFQQSPKTILPMFFAGEFPHQIEAVFCWDREGFYGFGSYMGSQNVMGSDYGNIISAT